MSIHRLVYETMHLDDTEVMELLGSGDIQTVRVRRAQMERYLSENSWDEIGYTQWIKTAPHPELPRLGEQAKNFLQASVQHAASGFNNVSPEEASKRQEICHTCEHLLEKDRCAKCGCYMKVKAKWQTSRCPIEKW